MDRLKTWPHLVIIGLICLALGAGAVVLWTKHAQPVQASALPGAARIDRVNGEVGLNRSLDSNTTNTQWVNAEQNTPVSVGDRIYTKDKSDASVAFTGRNFARLNEDTSLDVLALEDQKTQVALRDGSAVFDVGNLSSGELFEVATPCGAVDLNEPGLYQIEVNDDGNATATALSGVAQVVGQGGTGRIEKGEVLSVPCQGSAQPTLSRVEPRAAGTLVDHYYRYRYPRSYDGRYVSYDNYLNDPFYYDPSRRFTSYQYVSDYIPGVDDLDDYGDWQDVSGYGYCWRPRVDNGWAPYQAGYWSTDYPYGLTWISNEPWGYAPYHYGRWTFVGSQWFWVPERVRTRPIYSPALVAFIPFQTETIGWVPLGPGDPYAPRYYDPNWNPRYLTRTQVIQERVVNLNVPGAVTVVNVRNFNRPIDRRMIERVDAQQFAHVRPVLDPFAVRNFRDVALRTREGGRRFDVPARFAQRMERPVIASTTPVTPFRRDLAQKFQVRSVTEKARGEHWQLRDNRAPATAGLRTSPQLHPPDQAGSNERNLAAEQARERQMADLSREAARGNRSARQQMQQLQSQQRQEQQQQREQAAAQQRTQRMANQQAQGERVSNNAQKPKQAAQPGAQQPARANRGRDFVRGIPRANQQQGSQQQQQRTLRQRQPQPQAQPRDRQRYMGPPVRERANRAQPPQPKAAPQPRVINEPRSQRPVQPRPQPQMHREAAPMRQQQPRPQPQVQRQPQQMRQQPQVQRQPQQMRQQQQPRPQAQRQQQQQPQPQPQKQEKKNQRRPPN